MNFPDFQPWWRKLFEPQNEFVLRWLSPGQRRELERQMLDDADAFVKTLIGGE